MKKKKNNLKKEYRVIKTCHIKKEVKKKRDIEKNYLI